MSNINEVVEKEVNMTTMNKGVLASGLAKFLSGPGPFTLLVPSDLAFGKLETGKVADLLKPENKIKLTGLLHHHIIEGKVEFKDLIDGTKLKALDGKELSVKVIAGKVMIDGAAVQNRDVATSNGVIHSLDTVLKN